MIDRTAMEANPYSPINGHIDPCSPNTFTRNVQVINNVRIAKCDGKIFVNENQLTLPYTMSLNVNFDDFGKLFINGVQVPDQYYNRN